MRGGGAMMAGLPTSPFPIAMAARFKRLLLIAILLLGAVPAASAHDRAVTLALGMPTRLALDRAYDAVIVGDPGIVDVKTGDSQSVLIEPLKPGKTNLVFVDAQGRVIANVRVSVCNASDACDAAAGRT
jgi:Flp pilus assembly secretin CpaC